MLDEFLLVLFDKYAELLKKRFSEDFQEVCVPPPPKLWPAYANALLPVDCVHR